MAQENYTYSPEILYILSENVQHSENIVSLKSPDAAFSVAINKKQKHSANFLTTDLLTR